MLSSKRSDQKSAKCPTQFFLHKFILLCPRAFLLPFSITFQIKMETETLNSLSRRELQVIHRDSLTVSPRYALSKIIFTPPWQKRIWRKSMVSKRTARLLVFFFLGSAHLPVDRPTSSDSSSPKYSLRRSFDSAL